MTGMARVTNSSSTLHEQFLRQTQQIADSKSWAWLTTGGLKKESEGFLMAAQDQALRTNAIKVKIDKEEGEAMCRNYIVTVLLQECITRHAQQNASH